MVGKLQCKEVMLKALTLFFFFHVVTMFENVLDLHVSKQSAAIKSFISGQIHVCHCLLVKANLL